MKTPDQEEPILNRTNLVATMRINYACITFIIFVPLASLSMKMRKSFMVHFTEPYVITSGAKRRGPWFKQGHRINSPISVRHDAGLARGWIFILMIKKKKCWCFRDHIDTGACLNHKKNACAPCLCLQVRQQETRPLRLRSVYLWCLWRGLLQPQPLHCWGKARDHFQYSRFLLESSKMQRKKRPACSAFIRNLTSRFTSRFKAAGSISTKKLCLLVCLCRKMQSTAFLKKFLKAVLTQITLNTFTVN